MTETIQRWLADQQTGLTDKQTFKRYLLAFSGGVDSTALLLLMRAISAQLDAPLLAVHVNHGLSPEAGNWARHCQQVCQHLGIPLQVLQAEIVSSSRQGFEARAREARYAAFARISSAGDCLLTGQHADDQSETLLLHLLRGSGIDGLAGIHPLRRWNKNAWLGRPLLSYRRRQLVDYVHQEQLNWIEDPSNQDTRLRRNYLRHKILPPLEAVWPRAVKKINHSAEHCRDAASNLADLARIDLHKLQISQLDRQLQRLNLSQFLQLPLRRQRLLLRNWMQQQGLQTPGQNKLNHFLKQVAIGRSESKAEMCWQQQRMCIHAGFLYLDAALSEPVTTIQAWSEYSPVLGRLYFSAAFKDSHLQIKSRHGGEKIKLSGRDGSQSLKNLFQQAGIPPWLRNRVPLLWSADTLLAIGDIWLDVNFAQQLQNSGNQLCWEPATEYWLHLRNAILNPPE